MHSQLPIVGTAQIAWAKQPSPSPLHLNYPPAKASPLVRPRWPYFHYIGATPRAVIVPQQPAEATQRWLMEPTADQHQHGTPCSSWHSDLAVLSSTALERKPWAQHPDVAVPSLHPAGPRVKPRVRPMACCSSVCSCVMPGSSLWTISTSSTTACS